MLTYRKQTFKGSPYSLREPRWYRLCAATPGTATFRVVDGHRVSLRQCKATLHIPLLLEARSLPSAYDLLPEILAGLSPAQLILSSQVFTSGFHPPAYRSLSHLSLDDPSNISIIQFNRGDES